MFCITLWYYGQVCRLVSGAWLVLLVILSFKKGIGNHYLVSKLVQIKCFYCGLHILMSLHKRNVHDIYNYRNANESYLYKYLQFVDKAKGSQKYSIPANSISVNVTQQFDLSLLDLPLFKMSLLHNSTVSLTINQTREAPNVYVLSSCIKFVCIGKNISFTANVWYALQIWYSIWNYSIQIN